MEFCRVRAINFLSRWERFATWKWRDFRHWGKMYQWFAKLNASDGLQNWRECFTCGKNDDLLRHTRCNFWEIVSPLHKRYLYGTSADWEKRKRNESEESLWITRFGGRRKEPTGSEKSKVLDDCKYPAKLTQLKIETEDRCVSYSSIRSAWKLFTKPIGA
jgi:hypothetical protein